MLNNPARKVTAIAIAAIIFVGGYRSIDGGLSMSEFVSFLASLMLAYAPVRALAGLNIGFNEGMAAASRIYELIDKKNEIKEDKSLPDLKISSGNIIFKNVPNYFNNPNVCYFAASGDANTTSYPSVASNVISVGGTRLALNSDWTRNNETPWIYAGSGYSVSCPKPYYQPTLPSNRNNKRRMIPDVTGVAAPGTGAIIIVNGSAYSVGGTSLSCPIMAGIVSLAIQKRINTNKSNLTSVMNVLSNSIKLQPLLYNKSNKNIFHDIVRGKDGIYSATPGFDLASGLGAINCQNLINVIGNV
jgi:ABC-type multidrug transport system fused ATPase/permease subunit